MNIKIKESGAGLGSSFVLEVPLHYLYPSIIFSVPCDQIVQRAYSAGLKRFIIKIIEGESTEANDFSHIL